MSEYLIKVNWVDILILILLIRTSYVGFTQGLSYEAFTLIGIIASIVVAIHNYKYLGNFFAEQITLPIEFSNFLGFIILSVGTFLICRYIRILFFRFAKVEIFSNLERFGGLIFGFMRGCLLTSLILLCLLLIPNDYVKNSIQERSFAGLAFLKIAPASYNGLIGIFPRFRETEKSKIVEELLTHEPSEKKIKSHTKKQLKK